MRYQNVVIRSSERLEKMGREMRDAIFEIYNRGGFKGKSFPIVYQYTKGRDSWLDKQYKILWWWAVESKQG